MNREHFRTVVEKAIIDCALIATGIVCNNIGDDSTSKQRVEDIKTLTDIIIPLYMEKVLLAEEKQSESQRLLQNLKLLQQSDEVYEVGIKKARDDDNDYDTVQEHTQKANVILSMLFKELNIEKTGEVRTDKSTVKDMDVFMEAVDLAIN